MIDLHNHILPEVDDGATSLDMACEMAADLVRQGVTTVCATPHVIDWSRIEGTADVQRRVRDLQAALDERGIDLRMAPGAEVRISSNLPADLASGRAPTLNGTSYLLLEFAYDSLPPLYDKLIFQLRAQGFRTIIAHPERIAPIAADPVILYDLVRQGCLAQITAASIAGEFGPRPREAADLMLEHRLAHIVASDAHDRGARLQCLGAARRACGERATALFEDTPAAILAGQPVHAVEPLEIKRRKFLGIFG